MKQPRSNQPELPSPPISVLMPAYNAADTVAAAIDSILGQDFSDFELLIIDDGSTDKTPEILARFQLTDERIKVLRRPHRGLVAALNEGLSATGAPLVARMDADDVSFPERLSVQAEFLRRHPKVDMVGSLVEFGGDRDRQAGYAAYVDWQNSLVTPAEIALNRFVESPFAHPSVMFHRRLVELHGGYRQGLFPEDYELWLRWLEAGVRMAKCPQPLLVWRDPPSRLSRNDRRYDPRAFFRCKSEYLARWLRRHNPCHPRVTVWGAGRETRRRIEPITEHGVRIAAYIDIDPRKIGQTIHGRPVIGADCLPPPGNSFIVACVGARGAREDIRRRLRERNYREGQDFVVAG